MLNIYLTPGKEKYRSLNVNPDDYNWQDTKLEFKMSFKTGFDVSYSLDHPDYKLIIRPKRLYPSKDFEDIFGLSYNGIGYSDDLVVAILNHN